MANIELPQLGESVDEGVITAWLVKVGDTVEMDQSIVEIATDKVDTEIPSPVAGTVRELLAAVDDTVAVGTVIAVIDDGTIAPSDDELPANASVAPASAAPAVATPTAAPEATPTASTKNTRTGGVSSPLVRRLLRAAGLDPATVPGTGPAGRITRDDAERAIAGTAPTVTGSSTAASKSPVPTPPQPAGATARPTVSVPQAADRGRPEASPTQVVFDGARALTQDLTRIRKAIARGMTASLHSTAQLTAAVEIDMTAIMNLRAAVKDEFKAREGASLSPLPFICRAVTMTLPRHPTVNASMDLDSGTATFHNFVNLGIAVDTERGLVVPNIKDADSLTVPGLAKGIADLAKRTRDKKLQPDEISGATFTITNTGSRGTLFDTPILNAPESAILAACSIEKRPIVVSDAYGDSIAIRWMTYLCITYDHRLLDGADAARFLQDIKWVLERHDFSGELSI